MKRYTARVVFCILLVGSIFLLNLSDVEVNNAAEDFEEFGSIAQVGDLNEGRYNHTATLLNDGQVLVTGGTSDGKTALGSAELFNPVNEKWSATSKISKARMRHTATLLDSGKVLIVGGYEGNGGGHPSLLRHLNGSGNISLGSCEIFDPIKGVFNPVPSLQTGRFWHRAVKLHDGRVLVIGGLNVSHGALSSCEIYDPGNGQWVEASEMNKARVRFTATLLNNGSVLVTGGHDGAGKVPFSSCELYVPEKDTWYEVAPMNRARGYHSAVLMADGKVMVSGGFSGPKKPDWSDAEIYDPAMNAWTLAGNMSLPRHNHESVSLPTGEIIIFGGSNCLTGGAHSGIEYYDPDENMWQNTNLVMLGLKWTVAIALDDNSILISGGRTCIDASDITYKYIPPSYGDEAGDEDTRLISGFLGKTSIIAVIVSISVFNYVRLKRGKPS